uniref:Putative serpin n=1 Tax=Aedes albopictus TaxID=7160 RepID=A0A023ESX4_AEDAL
MQLFLMTFALLLYSSAAQTRWPKWRVEPMVNRRGSSQPTEFGFFRRSSQLVSPRASLRQTPAQNDEQLANAVVDMALAIGRISADPNSPAEVFSPVSIMGVLNMLLLAADGVTRAELYGALRVNDKTAFGMYHRRATGMLKNFQSNQPAQLDRLSWKAESCVSQDYDYEYGDDTYKAPPIEKVHILKLANAIFAQDNLALSQKFSTAANEFYGANTQRVNFRNAAAAASTINNWVYKATNGKIREIVSGSFSSETSLVIASSLYFKATWQNEFIPKITKPKDFFPDGKGRPSVKVDMMSLIECLPYHYEKSMGFKMIGLPYSDNSTTMYVMLPQDSTRGKVRDLQSRLTAAKIDSMIPLMTRRSATVSFPRMQLESSTNLQKAFRVLGIKSIFNAQHSNLQNMLEPSAQKVQKLFVSEINHKVNLSVDEKGTEGAAVTMTLIDRSASAVYFNVNQPFLIYIRHDPTRLPLFYGAVFDPRG